MLGSYRLDLSSCGCSFGLPQIAWIWGVITCQARTFLDADHADEKDILLGMVYPSVKVRTTQALAMCEA
jgi:hypothetical protein